MLNLETKLIGMSIPAYYLDQQDIVCLLLPITISQQQLSTNNVNITHKKTKEKKHAQSWRGIDRVVSS